MNEVCETVSQLRQKLLSKGFLIAAESIENCETLEEAREIAAEDLGWTYIDEVISTLK